MTAAELQSQNTMHKQQCWHHTTFVLQRLLQRGSNLLESSLLERMDRWTGEGVRGVTVGARGTWKGNQVTGRREVDGR